MSGGPNCATADITILFFFGGVKMVNVKIIKNDKIIKVSDLRDVTQEDIEAADSYRIKNKFKLDLTQLDDQERLNLIKLELKHNSKYIKRFNLFYKEFLKEDLKNSRLFNISKANKTKNMLVLSFNPGVCCNNPKCNNILRCYSKKLEKLRHNILKCIARQASIFNNLPVEDLAGKMKQEIIKYLKNQENPEKYIRLCEYGSITGKQFNKLLQVLNILEPFLIENSIKFYIYLDDYKPVPNELKSLINNVIVLNSSNIYTYYRFKEHKIKTNLIVSVPVEEYQESKRDQANYFYCPGNCKGCTGCKEHQEKPILFKNH